MPDYYVEEENSNSSEFTAPSTIMTPKENDMEIVDTDIVEDTAEDVSEPLTSLIIHEDENEADPDLRCEEMMDDVSVAESTEEFEARD